MTGYDAEISMNDGITLQSIFKKIFLRDFPDHTSVGKITYFFMKLVLLF